MSSKEQRKLMCQAVILAYLSAILVATVVPGLVHADVPRDATTKETK